MTPEDQLQITVAAFLDRALPADAVWFHIANQRQTSPRQGAKLKRMGVKAGVPDLCIIWRGRPIFIELKAPKTATHRAGRTSQEQGEMLSSLTLAGAVVDVCRSRDDVAEFLAGIVPIRGRVSA